MRQRMKIDTWQNDDGTWSAQVTVIVPGVDDWFAAAGGMKSYEDTIVWCSLQLDNALEAVADA